jgi:hypothetical protein
MSKDQELSGLRTKQIHKIADGNDKVSDLLTRLSEEDPTAFKTIWDLVVALDLRGDIIWQIYQANNDDINRLIQHLTCMTPERMRITKGVTVGGAMLVLHGGHSRAAPLLARLADASTKEFRNILKILDTHGIYNEKIWQLCQTSCGGDVERFRLYLLSLAWPP